MPFTVNKVDLNGHDDDDKISHGESVFRYSIPTPSGSKAQFSPGLVKTDLTLSTNHHEYEIILTQSQSSNNRSPQHHSNHSTSNGTTHYTTRSSFILFHSPIMHSTLQPIESELAFVEIVDALCPFIANGSVMLSKPLLEVLLLPSPITDPNILVHQLLRLIHLHPTHHPRWAAVIESLLNGVGRITENHRNRLKSLIAIAKLRNLNSINLFMLPLLIAAPCTVTDALVGGSDVPVILELNYTKDLYFHSPDKTTMIMEAVASRYTWSCLYLLSMGVDSNLRQQDEMGDTPLHIAVRNEDLLMVKLLLSFGADPLIYNNYNETPSMIAESGEHCNHLISSVLLHIHKLQVIANEYYSTSSITVAAQDEDTCGGKPSMDGITLLSLDGGGAKLITTTKILLNIENRLKGLLPHNSSSITLEAFFNYFAGTSIGSTLASYLAYRNGSVQVAMVIILECMDGVMKKPVKQQPACMKQIILDYFGEENVLSDLHQDRKAIIITSLANVIPFKLHIMSSYGDARDGQLGPNERKIWEALTAAMVAPSYFPPYDSFIDGGLIANNPTLVAMKEVLQNERGSPDHCKLRCVLSVGTGYAPSRTVDNVGNISFGMSVRKLSDSYAGIKNLFSHLMAHALETDGVVEEVADTWCQSIGSSYFRLSPALQNEVSLLATDVDEIVSMLFNTEVYLLKEHKTIDLVAKSLVSAKYATR